MYFRSSYLSFSFSVFFRPCFLSSFFSSSYAICAQRSLPIKPILGVSRRELQVLSAAASRKRRILLGDPSRERRRASYFCAEKIMRSTRYNGRTHSCIRTRFFLSLSFFSLSLSLTAVLSLITLGNVTHLRIQADTRT